MKIHRLHRWTVDLERARAIQLDLASRVRVSGGSGEPRRVAGADVSYDDARGLAFAAVVVLAWPGLEPLEERTAIGPVRFPYVPGYLSFREIPILLRAFARVTMVPDVVLCDGQGIAHPRGLGLASHLGLFLDCPTIGCAKSRFIGAHADPGVARGSRTSLIHLGREVGAVLRTREGAAPIYVSIGHALHLERACAIALAAACASRIPEPTRLADRRVAELRRRHVERIGKRE